MPALGEEGWLQALTEKKRKKKCSETPMHFPNVYHLLITYLPFSLDTHLKLNKKQCKNEAQSLFPRCTEITIAAG